MKYLFIIALMFMVGIAYADQSQTEGAVYTSPNGEATEFAEYLNSQEYIDHTHTTQYIPEERDKSIVGGGVDLVVWENEDINATLEDVEIQIKYDTENDESSTYAVVKVNLFNMFKRIQKEGK